MRSISGFSEKCIRADAIAQLKRRIEGIERCIDRMIALPLTLRDNWWRGQLGYFHRQLKQYRKALAEMEKQ